MKSYYNVICTISYIKEDQYEKIRMRGYEQV